MLEERVLDLNSPYVFLLLRTAAIKPATTIAPMIAAMRIRPSVVGTASVGVSDGSP